MTPSGQDFSAHDRRAALQGRCDESADPSLKFFRKHVIRIILECRRAPARIGRLLQFGAPPPPSSGK